MADDSDLALFLDAVRAVAGEGVLDTLRREFGGSCLFVPCARLREASPLAKALGMTTAAAVVDRLRVIGADGRPLGGFDVYIAAGSDSARETARAAAVDAVRAGTTRRAAARLVGLSERTVQRAVRRAGIPAQADLSASVDAAIIAAHAENPSGPAMAACLGVDLDLLHRRLARARRRTGLALQVAPRVRPARTRGPPRPARTRGTSRSEAASARDAAVIAAHAAEPTIVAMGSRLGIGLECMRSRLARARKRTGLPLALRAHPPAPRTARCARRGRAGSDAALIAAHAAGFSPPEIAERMGWQLGYVYCRFWKLRRKTGLPFAFSRRPYHEELWGEHVRSRQAQVETLLREGLSRRQIAARLGISRSTVGNFRARVRETTGESFAPPPPDHPNVRQGQERRRAIAEAYVPGLTVAELAARLGWAEPVVRHHLVRLRREKGGLFALAPRRSAVDRTTRDMCHGEISP